MIRCFKVRGCAADASVVSVFTPSFLSPCGSRAVTVPVAMSIASS